VQLIEKLEGTTRDMITINKDMSAQLTTLEADKQRLETEGARSNQLLRDITDAQQITCKKFDEFQKEIHSLRAENRVLKDQGRPMREDHKVTENLMSAEESIRKMKEEL
jgi:hypothetical protein